MKLRGNHIAGLVIAGLAAAIVIVIAADRRTGGGAESEDWLDGVRESARETRGAGTERRGLLPPVGTDPENAPRIAVEETDIDAGVISRRGVTEFDLTVYNEGRRELRIEDVLTECGCTVGDIERSRIPPGQSSTMVVSLDPSLMGGFESDYTLTILSNDFRNPQFPVRVRARVEPEFAIEPERVDFGEVSMGAAAEERVRIRRLVDEPFEVIGVEPLGNVPGLEVTYAELPEDEWREPGKKEYEARLRMTPQQAGPFTGYFQVLTSLERLPRWRGGLQGQAITFYTISSQRLNVTEARYPGDEGIATATITAQRPIEIEDLRITSPDFTVALREDDEPGVKHIEVGIAPGAEPGRRAARIDFEINGGGEQAEESIQLVALIGDPQQARR